VGVTLAPVADAGTGTLEYTVTYPATATIVLTLTNLAGGTVTLTDASPTSDATISQSGIPAGYYALTASLTDSTGKTAGHSEVVHIYQGLTTTVGAGDGFAFGAGAFTVQTVVDLSGLTITDDIRDAIITAYATPESLAGSGSAADPWVVPIKGLDLSTPADLLALYLGAAAAFPDTTGGAWGDISLDLSGCTATTGKITGLISLADATRKRFAAITLPAAVTTLEPVGGFGAIDYFVNLKSISAPGVTDVGNIAFSNCTSLTTVNLPLAETIGNKAFERCTALNSITLPDSVTTIGNNAFERCTALNSITLSDSVTTIGNYAFYYCTALNSITIPDSVTTIGDSAFYNCVLLASITIPDSVTTIGNFAFESCTTLATVTFLRPSPPSVGSYVFYSTPGLTTVHVPNGKVTDYKTALTGKGIAGGTTITDTAAGGSTTDTF
jgi:hypothetical protein